MIPQIILDQCAELGWTDPEIDRHGKWWAYPPGASIVMKAPLPTTGSRLRVSAGAERAVRMVIQRKLYCGEPREVRASQVAAEASLSLIEASSVLNHFCRQGFVDQCRTPEGYVYILRSDPREDPNIAPELMGQYLAQNLTIDGFAIIEERSTWRDEPRLPIHFRQPAGIPAEHPVGE
jgi:hypothetical protein